MTASVRRHKHRQKMRRMQGETCIDKTWAYALRAPNRSAQAKYIQKLGTRAHAPRSRRNGCPPLNAPTILTFSVAEEEDEVPRLQRAVQLSALQGDGLCASNGRGLGEDGCGAGGGHFSSRKSCLTIKTVTATETDKVQQGYTSHKQSARCLRVTTKRNT